MLPKGKYLYKMDDGVYQKTKNTRILGTPPASEIQVLK
jgi:hypothetical protein